MIDSVVTLSVVGGATTSPTGCIADWVMGADSGSMISTEVGISGSSVIGWGSDCSGCLACELCFGLTAVLVFANWITS